MENKRALIIAAVFVFSCVSFAASEEPLEQSPNPFLTSEEKEAAKNLGARFPVSNLIVSAIFYSGTASRVIINGQTLEKGDIIDGKEIVDITREEVILKDAQREYSIKMKNVSDKTDTAS